MQLLAWLIVNAGSLVLELGKVCIPLTSQSLFGETGIGGGVLIKLSRFISAMTTGVGDMQCTAGD